MEVAHGEMAMFATLAEPRNDLRMTLRLADLDLLITYDTFCILYIVLHVAFWNLNSLICS